MEGKPVVSSSLNVVAIVPQPRARQPGPSIEYVLASSLVDAIVRQLHSGPGMVRCHGNHCRNRFCHESSSHGSFFVGECLDGLCGWHKEGVPGGLKGRLAFDTRNTWGNDDHARGRCLRAPMMMWKRKLEHSVVALH
jgi:hypothetical protein